jgi:hypothetical protein
MNRLDTRMQKLEQKNGIGRTKFFVVEVPYERDIGSSEIEAVILDYDSAYKSERDICIHLNKFGEGSDISVVNSFHGR